MHKRICKRYNLRFEEFFTGGELEELPGIRITHINVVSLLIREEDIQNARKAALGSKTAKRPRVSPGGAARPARRASAAPRQGAPASALAGKAAPSSARAETTPSSAASTAKSATE